MMQNLAANNTWQEYDKNIAYGIFIIEKEFHVGPVTGQFYVTKFWNLLDKDNLERYNKSMNSKTPGNGKDVKTLGR